MKKSLLFITSMLAINIYLNVKASEYNPCLKNKDFSAQQASRDRHKATIMNSLVRKPIANDSHEVYSLAETIALEKLTEEINDKAARIKNKRKDTLQRINTKFTQQQADKPLQTIKYGVNKAAHSPQHINYNFSPTHR